MPGMRRISVDVRIWSGQAHGLPAAAAIHVDALGQSIWREADTSYPWSKTDPLERLGPCIDEWLALRIASEQ